jgi:hypothetical protein
MYFQKSASGFKRQRKCYWKWDCRFVLLNVHQTRKQSTWLPGAFEKQSTKVQKVQIIFRIIPALRPILYKKTKLWSFEVSNIHNLLTIRLWMFNFSVDLGHYYTAKQNIELSKFRSSELIDVDASRIIPRWTRYGNWRVHNKYSYSYNISSIYELFKLHYFHLLVLFVRSELRCNSPSPDSILSPHIGPYLLHYSSAFQKRDRSEVAEVGRNFLSPQIFVWSFTSKIHVLDSAHS